MLIFHIFTEYGLIYNISVIFLLLTLVFLLDILSRVLFAKVRQFFYLSQNVY